MKLYLQHIVIIETDLIILPQLSKEWLKSSTLWKKREVNKASENEHIIQSVAKLVETLCPEGHISYSVFSTQSTSIWEMKLSLLIPSKNCTSKKEIVPFSPPPSQKDHIKRFGCLQTAVFRKVDIYTRIRNSQSQVLLTLSVNFTRCFFVFCCLFCYNFCRFSLCFERFCLLMEEYVLLKSFTKDCWRAFCQLLCHSLT